MSQKDNQHRFPQLDSLRGYAALGVVLGHLFLTNGNYYILMQPKWFFVSGYESVIMFFVLSGFVLTNNLLSMKYSACNFKQLLCFYIRRYFRIYPVYYFAILLSAILWLIARPINIPEYSTFFNTWSQANLNDDLLYHTLILIDSTGNSLNPVVWTLVYEVTISIVFPFLFIFIKFFKRPMLICMLLIILSLKYTNGHSGVINGTLYYSQFFIWGIIARLYLNTFSRLFKSIFWFPVFLLSYASCYFFYHPDFIYSNPGVRDTLCAIGSFGIIIVSIANLNFSRIINNMFFRFLGKISYPLYICHLPILYFVTFISFGKISLVFSDVIILVIVLLVSYLVHHLIEKRAINFSKSFVGKI